MWERGYQEEKKKKNERKHETVDSKNLSFTGDVFGVEDFCMLLWWDLHWRYLSKRVATAFITSPLQSFCRDVRQRNRLLLSIFSSLTTLNFAKQHTHTYTYTTHIEDISGSQFSLWHTKEREKRGKENRTFLCQKKKKRKKICNWSVCASLLRERGLWCIKDVCLEEALRRSRVHPALRHSRCYERF